MDKLIRDGKVAILYSPDYGCGWYYQNIDHPECLFDPDIAKIVLGEETGDISAIAEQKWGEDFSTYGASDLRVEWLPVGTEFYISEYDGSESVITTKQVYMIA